MGLQNGAAILENNLAGPEKGKSSYQRTQQLTPSEGICPHKNLYIDVQSSIIYNNQHMNTI